MTQQSTVLDRIATALETIAAALTGQPATPAPRARRPQPDTEFEWEPQDATPAASPLPDPTVEERCGFRVEKYVNPLDRVTTIYQVSKAGASVLLTQQEGDRLAGMDDKEFTGFLAPKLAKVLAERARNGQGPRGEVDPEVLARRGEERELREQIDAADSE